MKTAYKIEKKTMVTWDSTTEKWGTKSKFNLIATYDCPVFTRTLGIWGILVIIVSALLLAYLSNYSPSGNYDVLGLGIVAGMFSIILSKLLGDITILKSFKTKKGAERYLEGMNK